MPSHPGKWALFDTNIYINAIREGTGSSAYEQLLQNLPHTFLSSVVSAELYAGCTDDITLRLVKQFTERFEKTGRIVTPNHQNWNQAGMVLAKINKAHPKYKSKSSQLFRDVLIATSAHQIGAILYTNDIEDFRIIRKYINFSLYA
ncbi:MAG: PIN domain-containing protein [Nitrospirae bacterium]|nr:PIN domain-containing protein [Nitrospirota bacterium]